MANGLLNNLLAYYKCDEAAATDSLEDAHTNAKHLTDVNSPTVVASGRINGARGFLVASSRRFSRADTAFKFQNDFTVSFWWKCGATGGSTQAIVAADNTGTPSRGWGVVQSSVTSKLSFYASTNGTSVTSVEFDLVLVIGTRYFVTARRTGSTLAISVTEEGSANRAAETTGTLAGTLNQADCPFSVGCRHSNASTTTSYCTGEIDELYIANAAQTTTQLDYLYEGEDGLGPLEYSEFDLGTVISLTSPVDYQLFQRDALDVADIDITGTYGGSPTAIEARWNGGAWTTIDAAPAGGTYSGTLANQTAGQGTLEVRFTNDVLITDSAAYVGVGELFLCWGQSNMSGRGTSNQSYTHATLRAVLFGNDYLWKNLVDPYDSNSSQVDAVSSDAAAAGSFIPLLATELMSRLGVPVGFIPANKGGTSITEHLPGVDHQDRTTLYGSAVYRALQVGGVLAVLYYQGETDGLDGSTTGLTNMPAATFNGHLDTIANAVQVDLGVKLMPCKLHLCTDRDITLVNQGIATAWGDNANVLTGPDLTTLGSLVGVDGVHINSSANLLLVAEAWADAIELALFTEDESDVEAQSDDGGGGVMATRRRRRRWEYWWMEV